MALGRRKPIPAVAATAVALFAAAAGWVLLQQGEGALVYFACRAAGPPLGIGLGLAGLAICAGAAGLAWRVATADPDLTRRFLGRLGLGAAAIFGFASLVMTAAVWLEPACAR